MSDTGRVTFSVSRSAEVAWTGSAQAGTGLITTPSGVLAETPVTFVTRTGEPDGHTSPEELIAAAHASCFAMSLAGALGTAGIAFTSADVAATLTMGRVDGVPRLTAAVVEVVVAGDDLRSSAVQAAVEAADARCPVSTALRATMPVTVSAHIRVA
jgi:lipoyl-dependent peroxiredoxin